MLPDRQTANHLTAVKFGSRIKPCVVVYQRRQLIKKRRTPHHNSKLSINSLTKSHSFSAPPPPSGWSYVHTPRLQNVFIDHGKSQLLDIPLTHRRVSPSLPHSAAETAVCVCSPLGGKKKKMWPGRPTPFSSLPYSSIITTYPTPRTGVSWSSPLTRLQIQHYVCVCVVWT